MYLNDNLMKQVKIYNELDSIWDKLKYCDDVVQYYDTSIYLSLNKDICYYYWKQEKLRMNFVFYT
jgi:hypothetical protein